MDKINKIMSLTTKKQGLYKLTEATRICYIAKELSNDEYDPISFKNGILTVKVENNIVAQKIQLNRFRIIKKINDKLNNHLVKKILFKVM